MDLEYYNAENSLDDKGQLVALVLYVIPKYCLEKKKRQQSCCVLDFWSRLAHFMVACTRYDWGYLAQGRGRDFCYIGWYISSNLKKHICY